MLSMPATDFLALLRSVFLWIIQLRFNPVFVRHTATPLTVGSAPDSFVGNMVINCPILDRFTLFSFWNSALILDHDTEPSDSRSLLNAAVTVCAID
jgi:hypothetical protein